MASKIAMKASVAGMNSSPTPFAGDRPFDSTMKALFIMSLVSALLSLLAIAGLSAMTIIPGPGAESFRAATMGVVSVFFVAWLSLALWARSRQQTVTDTFIPRWLIRVLVLMSVVYSLGILLFVLG